MISTMISSRQWHTVRAFFFLSLTIVVDGAAVTEKSSSGGRGMFSPRMDYEQWTPLGHGDPLKNDPTYDYVPPVLDRVSYWLEPEARTPDPPLTTAASQVLLLGVPAKKSPGKQELKKVAQADSRRDSFDPLMHFINERKHSVSRLRPQYIPLQGGGYLPHRPAVRPPYTMLVPPPPVPYPQTNSGTMDHHTTTLEATTTETEIANVTARTTEALPSSTEGTTFGTSDSTPSTTPHVHKMISPMIDIHANSQQSLSSSLLQILLQNEMSTPQSQEVSSTTPHPSLTTDPLFSHYKQPVEPLRGPMYLIIQGHSKVKTYGASKLGKLSGIPMEDDNEVGNRRRRSRQVDLEDFLPVEETLEAVVRDYIDNEATAEGSGLKQFLSAVTS